MYAADYHVHSTCSPDGKMTMSQAAEAALRAGLDEICITDHVDTIYWGSNEPRDSFDWDASMIQYLEAVDKFGDKLSIKLGAELGEANLAFDRAEILLNSAKSWTFPSVRCILVVKSSIVWTFTSWRRERVPTTMPPSSRIT